MVLLCVIYVFFEVSTKTARSADSLYVSAAPPSRSPAEFNQCY